jgi:hypothetical protein
MHARMSRALNDLDPRFRPLAMELLARCCEVGVPVLIVDTLRTPEEHARNLATGVSWITHSKHLDGLAIDICPYAHFELHGGPNKLQWDASDPIWRTLAVIGRKLGLRCGYDWKQKDCSHFEYVGPAATTDHRA